MNGEAVVLTQGTGASSSANAGSYAGSALSNLAISVTGGKMLASNYALPASGTLTIGQATVSVTGATGVNKTYDGTAALPAGASGFTMTGIYNSDANALTVGAASAAYGSANLGAEPVNVAGLTLTGSGAGNYVLSAASVTGSGTITPMPSTGTGTISTTPVIVTVDTTSAVATPIPSLPAVDLASTTTHNYERVLIDQGDTTLGDTNLGTTNLGTTLPILSPTLAGEDTLASRVVRGLSDPRFDQIIVCSKDVCTVVSLSVRPAQPVGRTVSQLEPRSR